jgi:ABC-type glycerol-3-phosphate transport system substrate-binding protein
MDLQRRSSLLKFAALSLASMISLPTLALAQQKEVRWGQWKGTEVGEKFMGELKAAFEKDHPDIKLTPVDSPFSGCIRPRSCPTCCSSRSTGWRSSPISA